MGKERIREGYKIFRIGKNGELRSCTIGGDSISYNEDKKTYRKITNGALAVFTNRGDLTNFLCKEYQLAQNIVVFKVKYKQSKHRELFYYRIGRYGHRKYPIGYNVPEGTDFADWVKIIDR
jgi:hypothetical protein